MSRIYNNSESWIFRNQVINNDRYFERKDERYIDTFDTDKMVSRTIYNLPRDILEEKYKWNGKLGKLDYYKDTSVRSDFEMLNEYNEPYEEGRNTLLWDTCNRYPKNVSSYNVMNGLVRRKERENGVKLLIK